jgi:hypothetical protein
MKRLVVAAVLMSLSIPALAMSSHTAHFCTTFSRIMTLGNMDRDMRLSPQQTYRRLVNSGNTGNFPNKIVKQEVNHIYFQQVAIPASILFLPSFSSSVFSECVAQVHDRRYAPLK